MAWEAQDPQNLLRRLINIPIAQVGRLRTTYCVREIEMEMRIGNGVSYVMSLPYGDGEPREGGGGGGGGGETRTIYMCGHAGRLDIIACLCTRY